jgi:zinc transporter ZupT
LELVSTIGFRYANFVSLASFIGGCLAYIALEASLERFLPRSDDICIEVSVNDSNLAFGPVFKENGVSRREASMDINVNGVPHDSANQTVQETRPFIATEAKQDQLEVPQGDLVLQRVLTRDTETQVSDQHHTAAEMKKLRATCFIKLIAMIMHQVPEGVLFFVSVTTDVKLGAVIGIMLLLQVIPEGLGIGAPTLMAYPKQQWRVPLYGIIAGMGEPIGAIIAFIAFQTSSPNNLGLGIVVGANSGMLFVIAIRGLLPHALQLDPKDKVTSYSVIAGIFAIFLSVSLFRVFS